MHVISLFSAAVSAHTFIAGLAVHGPRHGYLQFRRPNRRPVLPAHPTSADPHEIGASVSRLSHTTFLSLLRRFVVAICKRWRKCRMGRREDSWTLVCSARSASSQSIFTSRSLTPPSCPYSATSWWLPGNAGRSVGREGENIVGPWSAPPVPQAAQPIFTYPAATNIFQPLSPLSPLPPSLSAPHSGPPQIPMQLSPPPLPPPPPPLLPAETAHWPPQTESFFEPMPYLHRIACTCPNCTLYTAKHLEWSCLLSVKTATLKCGVDNICCGWGSLMLTPISTFAQFKSWLVVVCVQQALQCYCNSR